jgi:hypothetical protein
MNLGLRQHGPHRRLFDRKLHRPLQRRAFFGPGDQDMRGHRPFQNRRRQRDPRLARALGAHRHQGRRVIGQRRFEVVGPGKKACRVHVRPHAEQQDGQGQMPLQPLGKRPDLVLGRRGLGIERDQHRLGSP